jgi:hypothetical protein
VPNTRTANAIRLEFAPGSLVHANLSGAAFTGDWRWVAGDEGCGLDRLRRLDPVGGEVLRFGEVRDFPLADLLVLPGTAEEEADLEGMAAADVGGAAGNGSLIAGARGCAALGGPAALGRGSILGLLPHRAMGLLDRRPRLCSHRGHRSQAS